MTDYEALVEINTETQELTGRCLPYAQTFFGAPVMHDYAFQAWEATKHKHAPDEPLPDAPVLLWYSHYGTYYSHSKKVWEFVNAGHVTPYVPGDAIYSSPPAGFGSSRYGSIREIELTFGASYVGWSEDINGLRVAQPVPPTPPPPNLKGKFMKLIWDTNGTGYLITEDGVHPLPSAQVYKYFYRIINSDQSKIPFTSPPQVKDHKKGTPDTFYASELAVVGQMLRIVSASALTGVNLDLRKQLDAISDALGDKFEETTELSAAELASALETAADRIIAAMKRNVA